MRLNNKIHINPKQLLPTFDYTLTVLNKLKGFDTITKQDVWYVSEIPLCAFNNTVVKSVTGNTVSMGGAYRACIPKQKNYLPYSEWRKNPDGHVTFSVGDIVIKGKLNPEEIVTPNTVRDILEAHRPDAFEIRTFGDYTGTIELAEHYELEGI